MSDNISTGRGVAVALSVAVLLSVPGISFAGPGCMNDKRAAMGYYPRSPMPAQPAYWQGRPYGYQAAPGAHAGWMAAPYQRPTHNQSRNAAVSREPAAAVASPVSAGMVAVKDSKAAAETITVRISGMRFEPAILTIKPGTTVNWVQSERMPHTVTGKGNELRSNTLQMNQTFSHTFNESGSYEYACDFHPSMQGVVKVMEAGQDT